MATTLAAIPDGAAKNGGIAEGKQEAALVLLQRQGDGLDTASVDIPFTSPPPGPGVWQPTPPAFAPAVRAGEGNARPFVLQAADQFDPGPPPSLSSPTYLRSLAEVRAYGSATSAVRTSQQTDVALFWEPAINVQYVQILRAVLADTRRSLSWKARFVAAFNVVTTDAQIAIYNAKVQVPLLASGHRDPNRIGGPRSELDTIVHDAEVSRLAQWPRRRRGRRPFLGPRAPAPISVTSPTDPGSTHVYDKWAQITREVITARAWEGIHFRFSDDVGAHVGRAVAGYDLPRLGSVGL